jgi:hypothetical protein
MSETSGFFNSNSGDRIYDAVDFAQYFGDLVSNGIFYATGTNLQVTPGSGMSVVVAIGSAWINGYHYKNTSTLTLSIGTANGTNPRIDRVVVRWDNANRQINTLVLAGSPAATPTPPALTRTNDYYDLCLADVLIPKSSASISSSNITDNRLTSSLCGLVNSLVAAVYQ